MHDHRDHDTTTTGQPVVVAVAVDWADLWTGEPSPEDAMLADLLARAWWQYRRGLRRRRPPVRLRPVAVVTIPRRCAYRRATPTRAGPDDEDPHEPHRVAGTTASPAPADLSATPARFTTAAL